MPHWIGNISSSQMKVHGKKRPRESNMKKEKHYDVFIHPESHITAHSEREARRKANARVHVRKS